MSYRHNFLVYYLHFQNTSNPREPVDFLATLNVFLTQHFNNMIRFIMNAEGRLKRFITVTQDIEPMRAC